MEQLELKGKHEPPEYFNQPGNNKATSLDFTMCNPPFYASRGEMIASAEGKERPPFSVSRSW